MQTAKTEEFYYLRLSPLSFSPLCSSESVYNDSIPQIISPYHSFLIVKQLALTTKQSQIFQDTETPSYKFYEITTKRPLVGSELQKCITIQYKQKGSYQQPKQLRFNVKLQEIMKRPTGKDQLFQRITIPSLDSALKTEIIIIPSYQPISPETLAKIAEQGDSKMTMDSHKYETLPTEESIGSTEQSQKFKRSTRLLPTKLQKKIKKAQIKRQLTLLDQPCDEDEVPPTPNSPHKRRFWMKRSRLVPQTSCLPQQIDQPQTYEQLKQQAGQILYTFGMFLQLLLIIFLMHPSSKI